MEELFDKEDKLEEIEILKNKVDEVIIRIIEKKERLVFANVVKDADISNITVFRHPEIRGYILNQIKLQKEIQCINAKIERVINNLKKRGKRVTFVAVMNKCKFSLEEIYRNDFIKERIRSEVIKNSSNFYQK